MQLTVVGEFPSDFIIVPVAMLSIGRCGQRIRHVDLAAAIHEDAVRLLCPLGNAQRVTHLKDGHQPQLS